MKAIPDLVKRRLLALPLAAALAAASRSGAAAAADNQLAALIGDRRELWLMRGSDELRASYWSAARGHDREAYLNLCWLMRDVQANRVFTMDRRLFDVLVGVQVWLARNGVQAPIEIHSGYRTRKTNNKIEGAALDSRHLIGQAADISVPGVSNVKLAGMASVLGRGGTGFYVGKGFVHVDCGDERIWVDQRMRRAMPG
jgi:uncharacterized protein YcbK (DUF882 family)